MDVNIFVATILAHTVVLVTVDINWEVTNNIAQVIFLQLTYIKSVMSIFLHINLLHFYKQSVLIL